MEEKIDIETFLDEMVSAINERLKKQERSLESIRKDIQLLKRKKKFEKRAISVDRSVLEVLKGK
jgi:hypothetical protein